MTESPPCPGCTINRMSTGTDDPSDSVLEAAEARLAGLAPGYLEAARGGAARLGVRDTSTDAGAVVAAVEELSLIDLDVPTGSRIPIARYAKRAVKRLVSWYLGYIGRQINAFGQAVANLGLMLVERTERIESDLRILDARVDQLTARMEALEQGGPAPR